MQGFRGGSKSAETRITTELSITGLLPADTEAEAEAVESEDFLIGLFEDHLLSYDITLYSGGEEYQPEEPVLVTIANPSIAKMYAEGREIVVGHIGKNGQPEAVEVLDHSDDSITFEAKSFSVYYLSGFMLNTLKAWVSGVFKLSVLGLQSLTACYAHLPVEAEEGLEVLESYSVSSTGLLSLLTGMWVEVSMQKSLTLDSRERLDVYSIENGELGELLA
ncbi:MAG: hypothetical protein IKR28_07350, partial [Selenomonadaceae bacterium]|nr:hypothetical protein [Selenomonadaceae bacterium]